MKKTGILILTLILVSTMFTGCRRGSHTDTTNGGTPSGSSSASRATLPSSSGIIPDGKDRTPGGSDGGDMSRMHRGPRY